MNFGDTRRRNPGGPLTNAEKVHAHVARHSLVEWRECEDPKRRAKLESNQQDWMRWYGREAFTRKFDRPHIEIINGSMAAYETGGRMLVGAERGVGKSTEFDWSCLFFALTGRRKFPVVLPWDAPMMAEAFEVWKAALCDNDRLLADYPEFCAPFAHAEGTPQRLAAQRWKGGPHDGEACGARLQVGAGRIIFPNCRGGIGGKTINGNPRGLKLPLSDGRILRPDMILIDEPQDDEVAQSPMLVAKTVRKINGAVAGMGQAGGSIPMLMAGNFIACNDVMDTYAHDPNWRCIRVPCVEQWPDGWADEGPIYKRWKEWWEEYNQQQGGPSRALKLYKANRDAMRKGMRLSAPNVYRLHVSRTLPDVFAAAMRRYWQDGHESFMAERQQAPVDLVTAAVPYTLTPQVVMSRVTTRAIWDRPEWVSRVFASSDINPSYAFSTVVPGFGEDQSNAVLWYGVHHLNIAVREMPAAEYARALYPELVKHGQALASSPCRPEAWALDAGGDQFDAIAPYVDRLSQATGLTVLAFTGRRGLKYAQYGQTVVKSQIREHCHGCATIKGAQRLRWIAWDSDYWGEKAQRAWFGVPGAPGQASLPAGRHWEFASQVSNKRLVKIEDKGGKIEHTWRNIPGKQDFHDAMAQAYALAAFFGIGTSGQVVLRKRKKYTQKDLER